MRRISLALALVASLVISATAFAASPPGKNRIICGPDPSTATVNGAQSCNFDVGVGEFAYAYYSTSTGGYFPNAWDKKLGSITQLSFRYAGTDPAGALRWSIQIDANGDGSGAEPNYVFIGADACNDGTGLVDVINDSTCTIYYGSEVYPNWGAFVAAYPTATLNFAFVIADAPWTGSISSLKIGKPGK